MIRKEEEVRGSTPTDEKQLVQLKKDRKREQRKLKKSKIPCRFYAMEGGCWRGARCIFLHSDNEKNTKCSSNKPIMDVVNRSKNENSMEQDSKPEDGMLGEGCDMGMMEVEELSKKLTSTVISVPESISFGRRKRH